MSSTEVGVLHPGWLQIEVTVDAFGALANKSGVLGLSFGAVQRGTIDTPAALRAVMS